MRHGKEATLIARRILLGLGIAAAAALFAAPSAQAATLSTSNGTIYYTADQGERNEVLVTTDIVLGLPVYNFADGGAAAITLGPGFCDVLNGVGTCSGGGIGSIVINGRDADDTIKIATGGPIGAVVHHQLVDRRPGSGHPDRGQRGRQAQGQQRP